MANGPKKAADEVDPSGSYKTYLEYNGVLRVWFVAFGVGGPVLLLEHADVARRLLDVHRLQLVVVLFLAGAAAQVMSSYFNKVANWYVHRDCVDASKQATENYEIKHRVAEWYSEAFWPDTVFDLTTIAAFGVAAWFMLTVLWVGNAAL